MEQRGYRECILQQKICPQIDFWDAEEKGLGLSLKDTVARRRVVEDFTKWASMEKISWRQKSREV